MQPTQITSGYLQVFNGQLYYEVAGAGTPVLFIHAGVADNSMWDSQFPFFSQFFRVIRYDTRGFGRSQTSDTGFSNRQDILDLFDHLEVRQACVIGISRGGQIAIDFTLEHPDRVSALVAVAAGVSGYEYHSDGSEKASRELELFNHADELWEHQAYDELADLEAHIWADGPSQPVGRAPSSIRNYVRQSVRANYTRQDGQATPTPLDPLAVNRLGEIKVPTLVLVGEYDTAGTLATADKIRQEVPHVQKVVIPGTAHLLPMEKATEFNEVVLDFLQRES